MEGVGRGRGEKTDEGDEVRTDGEEEEEEPRLMEEEREDLVKEAQTGLIRRSSNPSMMLTGGQTHKKREELRQAKRPTET